MCFPYKVTFVGAGAMSAAHMSAFKDIEGVEMSGITSRTASKAKVLANEYGVKHVYSSIEELYQCTKAELVVISVPVLEAHSVCLEAVKYPWKLLIEKPVGFDVDQAVKIQKAADDYGRDAFVALNRRHYASTRSVIDGLEGNDAPRLIQVFDQEDLFVARSSGQPELVVNNWMYANSIHVIDYLRMFGRGDIVSVESVIPWTPETPSFVSAKVQFSSGDVGLYDAVWNGPGPWAVTVTAGSKRWEMRPLEQVVVQQYPSRQVDTLPCNEWDVQYKPGVRLQAEEAIKAVKGMPHNLVSLAEGAEIMKLVRSIYGL